MHEDTLLGVRQGRERKERKNGLVEYGEDEGEKMKTRSR